jgi:Cft2 family RNA processing exonuclease
MMEGSAPKEFGYRQPTSVAWSPVFSDDSTQVRCSLLRLEGLTVLLDCGLPEKHDTEAIKELLAVAAAADIIVISHATYRHCGGLPYVVKHGCTAVILGTLAMHRLGKLGCGEAVMSALKHNPNFKALSLSDVDAAFALETQGGRFHQHRFMEEFEFKGVTFCPTAAGMF